MGRLKPEDDPVKYIQLILEEELNGNLDLAKISTAADQSFFANQSLFQGEYRALMTKLIAIQEGPEFELDRDELFKIKEQLKKIG